MPTIEQLRYLEDVNEELKNYTSSFVLNSFINTDKLTKQVKLILLSSYIDIITSYFYTVIEEDANFFTTDDAEDIMQHINYITNKDYWVTL